MLFGGNLKDALAKYTGKKDESVTSTTPEKPSQSGANEAQEKEKQKENLKINEATKLLVAINSEEGTPDAQKSQMAKFLSDRSFRSLPLSAIGPEFVRNGYKIKDNLQKTLKPSIEQSGVSLQDAEKALKCMFSQE